MHLVSGSLNFILSILWWWIFLSLIIFDMLMWIFIQINYWWWDEFLYISNVKNYSSVLKGSLCRRSKTFWSWGITCEKIWVQCWQDLYAGCQRYSGADVLFIKIRAQCRWDHYVVFRGPHNFSGFKAFERNHILSLPLRHLREIV